jgi:hypothetical protein
MASRTASQGYTDACSACADGGIKVQNPDLLVAANLYKNWHAHIPASILK